MPDDVFSEVFAANGASALMARYRALVDQITAARQQGSGAAALATGVDVARRADGTPELRLHVRDDAGAAGAAALEKLVPPPPAGSPLAVVRATYRRDDDPGPVGLFTRARAFLGTFFAPAAQLRNPLRPGHTAKGAGMAGQGGTIGLVVFDAQRRLHLLGSAHIFGGMGVRVHHPSYTAKPSYVAGLVAGRILDHRGDAAIARFGVEKDGVIHWPTIPVGGTRVEVQVCCAQADGSVVQRAAVARIGDRVRKVGASTDTGGEVESFGAFFLDGAPTAMQGFRVVGPAGDAIAQGGDSGAVWFRTDGGEPVGVGLHVGRSSPDSANRVAAIACHLPFVLDHLGVSPAIPTPRPDRPTIVAC